METVWPDEVLVLFPLQAARKNREKRQIHTSKSKLNHEVSNAVFLLCLKGRCGFNTNIIVTPLH